MCCTWQADSSPTTSENASDHHQSINCTATKQLLPAAVQDSTFKVTVLVVCALAAGLRSSITVFVLFLFWVVLLQRSFNITYEDPART
eukprot:m.231867 g.231867  ORF g.231867 m.231867 type:complete len:88 (+) comp54280_c0_seq10:1260-1523(+)